MVNKKPETSIVEEGMVVLIAIIAVIFTVLLQILFLQEATFFEFLIRSLAVFGVVYIIARYVFYRYRKIREFMKRPVEIKWLLLVIFTAIAIISLLAISTYNCMKSNKIQSLDIRYKQASLTLGYDILLWSAFHRVGVTSKPELWKEKGVIELSILEAGIQEKLTILDLQIDFPPKPLPSSEAFVLLFLEYDSLIKPKLAKKKEELVRLYNYGFTLGTIVISLVAEAISQKEVPLDKGDLPELSKVLIDQGEKINLPKNLIEESRQLHQEVKATSISPEKAEYLLSQYKELFDRVKDFVSS